MKTLLRISMLLNLGLAGGLVFALLNAPKRIADPATPVVAQARPQVNQEVNNAPPQPIPTAGPKPFHWSQLGSTNYLIYVKNLRGIGCPEPTLLAIVTADAQVVINQRRQFLEQKLAGFGSQSWSTRLGASQTEEELKTELQQLPDVETAVINQLLGLRPALTQPVAELARQVAPPSLPLVLQKVDPASLGLNNGQIQVIKELQQNLLDKIGGPNADQNDPANLERLQQAQPEADDMLRGMLGTSIYQYYQLAAANNQSLAAANP